MIQYKNFSFAAAPRTGTTWFIKACSLMKLGDKQKTKVHFPPPLDYNNYVVSSIRHPYDFLVSFFLALRGGATGVGCVDVFSFARHHNSPGSFIQRYLRDIPGEVGKMFDAYRANSVIRLEDLPWAAEEFFEGVGVPYETARRVHEITPQNVRKGEPHIVDKKLRKQVMEAEGDFCERHEYYY